MYSFKKSAVLLLSGFVLLAATCPAQSTTPANSSYIVVGGGAAGVFDSDTTIFGMLEFQPKFHIGSFGTWIALLASERDYYLATGLSLNWYVTERLFITPSFGAGVYAEHNGMDLGYPIEFRSGVECGYDFQKAGRISIGIWHISNGQLRDKNPGTELVALRYAMPIGNKD